MSIGFIVTGQLLMSGAGAAPVPTTCAVRATCSVRPALATFAVRGTPGARTYVGAPAGGVTPTVAAAPPPHAAPVPPAAPAAAVVPPVVNTSPTAGKSDAPSAPPADNASAAAARASSFGIARLFRRPKDAQPGQATQPDTSAAAPAPTPEPAAPRTIEPAPPLPAAPTPDIRPAPVMDHPRASAGVPDRGGRGACACARYRRGVRAPDRRGRRPPQHGHDVGGDLARPRAGQAGQGGTLDLALESPNLAAIASEADAPGISDLVMGSASFGQIITRDKYSRVHVITAGQAKADGATIMASPASRHHAGGARPQLRLCRGRRRRLAGDFAGAVCAACAARRAGGRRHRRARNRKRARAAVRGRLPQCERARKRAQRAGSG